MLDFLLTRTPLFYLTQSLWRDEAFSVLVAEKPVSFFFQKLTFEPPLYYIMLHVWMRIFGNGEIAVRTLSLTGVTLAAVIVIFWAERIYRDKFIQWFLPLFFFLNPMITYYAFEVRTYGWFIFFATLSLYAYGSNKWKLYAFASVLGFYTHTYFVFLILVTALHFLIWNGSRLLRNISFKKLRNDAYVKSALLTGIFILPWMFNIAVQSGKLKSSWYYPVDLQLIKSVLGNMFIGYEGTPWFLWPYTAVLSAFLAATFLLAFKYTKDRKRTSMFMLMVFVPLTLVIGISFIKPLYVNRYLIPVTIAEIFLITEALAAVKSRIMRTFIGLVLLAGISAFNLWYPDKHPKLPIRDTVAVVNRLAKPEDLIYATSPLIYFETVYYSPDRSRVYLYNPSSSPFPWYVGDVIFSEDRMVTDLPIFPKKAFLIQEKGDYSMSYTVYTPAGTR